MGLDQFKQTETAAGAARFRTYGQHDREDQLNEWADQLQEHFPEEIRIDFIEVSPEMTKHDAKAYWRKRDGEQFQYMRVAEHFLNKSDDRIILTLLHEMCHLYLYQKGYTDVTERHVMFTWLLGRVGASVSRISTDSEMWQDVAEPFLD